MRKFVNRVATTAASTVAAGVNGARSGLQQRTDERQRLSAAETLISDLRARLGMTPDEQTPAEILGYTVDEQTFTAMVPVDADNCITMRAHSNGTTVIVERLPEMFVIENLLDAFDGTDMSVAPNTKGRILVFNKRDARLRNLDWVAMMLANMVRAYKVYLLTQKDTEDEELKLA